MIRTQIQLTPTQARELKRLAAERDASVAELVRQAIDRLLREEGMDARWERALRALGLFDSGVGDIAVNHDKYLDEAYGH
ncbi:MAG: ribbon-helix-helix protein, CopG family [Actinobacteria bacterium]|nr:ribbon-helix-helix protein, CopG family [Actinomycetota bacterium]